MSNSGHFADYQQASHSGKQVKKRKRRHTANDSQKVSNINGSNVNFKQQKIKKGMLQPSLGEASSTNKYLTSSKTSNSQDDTSSLPSCSTRYRDSRDSSGNKQGKKEECDDNGSSKSKTRKASSLYGVGKHVKRKRWQGKSRSRAKVSCAEKQTNESSQEDDSTLEIPGFFYDKQKKKYFKILPSSNSVTNVVTKKRISCQEAENKRLKDLAKLESSNANSHKEKIHKFSPWAENITSLVYRHHQGDIGKSWLEHSYLQKQISWMKPAGTVKIFENPDVYSNIEHMLQIDANYNNDQLLGLWSVADSVIQRMQLLSLTEKPRLDTKHPLSVGVNTTGATVLQSWNKITSLCWSPFSNDVQKKYVLYTTMCYTRYSFSLAFIRNLDPESNEHVQVFDFNLGNYTTWTSAWNHHASQFSVGAEKTCLLIDVETRRLWEFNTNKSDALAQVFAPVNGLQLYNGTRKGQVLCHDLRSLSTRPVACMMHNTSIACMRISQNGNLLFVSDFSGRLCSWDIRMRRVVQEYQGLHNEYLRLPFKIDPTEEFIYGAGQDCYTNFWCLKSGKQLLHLPPPCPASIDTIPAVHYSTHWANKPGNNGLIMGIKDSLHLYSGRVLL